MHIQSLNGEWSLNQVGKDTAIPATVPGCVHTDLLEAGQLDDPFYRDNEKKQMWIGETDWRYKRTFVVDSALLRHEVVLLRCYGLDTIATIYINGAEIAKAENMFRTYEFDVKPNLVLGENRISIVFEAPATYARNMDDKRGELAGWVEPMRYNSGAWIRKEPCNFGWDWGPMTTTSGIWRDIELVGFSTARLDNILIRQHHDRGQVRLSVQLEAETLTNTNLMMKIELEFDGVVFTTIEESLVGTSPTLTVTISSPKLWWVAGMGDQPLYTVRAILLDNTTVLDTIEKRIGLRTTRLPGSRGP